jgi:outer membrane lipoprotein-sorting protein
MITVWLTRVFVLLFCYPAYALSPDEIVAKADDVRMPDGTIVFISHVQDFENNSLVHEAKYQVYNKGREKSLVETIFPDRQKGRKLLMDGNNLWFTTPDVKRPARVSMQQKLTGEVANGDLARTNYSGDYSATLAGQEMVNGQDSYKLALTSKHSGVTYAKIDYWISKKGFVPLKAVFYAVSGKVLKRAEFSDLKKVLGQKCITKTVFEDALDKSHKSVLIYKDHKRKSLSDSVFSKESLGD